MKSLRRTCIIAMTLLAVAIPVQLAAQDRTQPQHQYHHYQIVDPGTFGGPQSWQFYPVSPPRSPQQSGDVRRLMPTRLPWIRTVSGHQTAMPPTHSQWRNGVDNRSRRAARRHWQPGQLDQCERADGGSLRQRSAGSTEPGASATPRCALAARANDRSGDLAARWVRQRVLGRRRQQPRRGRRASLQHDSRSQLPVWLWVSVTGSLLEATE